MYNVGIIGATGYTGAELVRILSGHPDVRLTILTSRQHAGKKIEDIYPAFGHMVNSVLEDMNLDTIAAKADVVFTALPHKLPMDIVPALLDKGKKVIDLSADFRFKDVSLYEAHYQKHTSADLLKKAVYGLCEIYTEDIRESSIVGNPGCYPTSILLPTIPLVKEKLIETDMIISDSKSGVSGAGRSAALTSLYCEVTESFKAYKVLSHRHNPEIDSILSDQCHRSIHVVFVPHLVPMSRGMLSTIYARVKPDVTQQDLVECLQKHYQNRRFVRICKDDKLPDTRNVRGTNFCDIGVRVDQESGQAVIISAIDNLVKGASGQAVQNMNIMLGLEETRGLLNLPYPL